MLDITHTVKEKQPFKQWLFLFLKEQILGKKYDLSVAFVGETSSKKANLSSRGKNKSTNILSFPLNKTSGEILICPVVAKREYKKFDLSYQDFLTYLFIHGCLHLKGHDHGEEMEKLEDKYLTLALKQRNK
jgi:probable rRNA maturation factor